MANTNITITVASGTPDATMPIENAPVVLFNPNGTVNRVGFTHRNGEYVFVGVPDGSYGIIAMDPAAQRLQVLAATVGGTGTKLLALFANDPKDRGRIVATVLVGAVPAAGRIVNVYAPGGDVALFSQPTGANGKAIFPGLVGVFDVEGVGNGPGCTYRENNVNVPAGNVDVPVTLPLAAGC